MRNTALASLLALSLLACSGEGGGDAAAQATEALDRQDFIAARDSAALALKADPQDADMLLVLASSQVAIGQSDAALRAIDRLESVAGVSDESAMLRAEALLQQSRPQDARAAIEGIDNADAWRLRAIAAIREEDDAATREAFARGLQSHGESFKLRATQAHWFLEQGDVGSAAEAVAHLRKTAPDRIETLFVSARLAQAQGNGAEALSHFEQILERAPLDRPALLGAIAELGAAGRLGEVRPLVERGRKAMPNDVEFVFLAARLEAEDGNWRAVRDLIQGFETSLPDHPDARALYAQALLENGQAELARGHLAPLYRQYPDAPGYAEIYARALQETGDTAEAARIRALSAA